MLTAIFSTVLTIMSCFWHDISVNYNFIFSVHLVVLAGNSLGIKTFEEIKREKAIRSLMLSMFFIHISYSMLNIITIHSN